MNELWWQLSGVSGFVRRAVHWLRTGNNLVVCLPPDLPAGFDRRCVARIEETSGLEVTPLIVGKQATRSPRGLLAERFAPQAAVRAVENWHELLDSAMFKGRIFRLDFEGDSTARDTWLEFVRDYAQASRALPLEQRTVFLAFIEDQASLRLPAQDLSFVYHPWHGVVQPWDMAAYVAALIDELTISSLERQLVIAVVSELSRWDLRLASVLSQLSLRDLLTPQQALREFARDNGWETAKSWSERQPFHDAWNETPCWHSAIAVLRNDKGEIDRRIWHAQVAVLFPFLEVQRRQLLEKYRAQLRLPHRRTNGTVIHQHEDLEIGDLVHLQRTGFFKPREPLLIESFGRLRNKLAHLEAADYYTLKDCLRV